MDQDFFTYLPSEITIDILSRLPVRTVMRCKCVRKSWRNLIETHEFVKSYKSFPSLAIFRGKTVWNWNPYRIYELEDVLIRKNNSDTTSSFKEALNFDFPHRIPIHSSADGLLLLCLFDERGYKHLIVCNPVTREYINLPSPRPGKTDQLWPRLDSLGLGMSKTSGQYKLVRVYKGEKEHYDRPRCQVYTLGTGSWRSNIDVPSNIITLYGITTPGGAFLNWNLHWLALSSTGCQWIISCFDLESELFTTLSIPPHYDLDDRLKPPCCLSHSTLREESLCLCDARPDNEIVIWLMKEYGDDKSWTKQYVIPKIGPLYSYDECVRVIKVFNNGDVLLTKMDYYPKMVCYSNETKTFEENNVTEPIVDHFSDGAVSYTPSFLQLKTLFPGENVRSF